MNRRNFIESALKEAAVGFSILPSAVTYARSWKPTVSGVVVPFSDIYWESRWIPMPAAEWDAGFLDALRTPFYREYPQRSLQS